MKAGIHSKMLQKMSKILNSFSLAADFTGC